MSFTELLIHTVTLHSLVEGTQDRYGNAAETYSAGVSSPARVQQLDVGGQIRERLGGADVRTTYFKVFLPPSVSITGLSLIVWGSRRLNVDGEPHLVNDSDGPHHYEVNAEEIVGG